jgi:hypothetical protein
MNRFLLGILFATVTVTSTAGDTGSIFPFTFTENGLETEAVDFGQVPQGSFHQRFIVITNTSNLKVKDVSVKIAGNYRASNCMSLFLPGYSCMVILNYVAPGHISRDKKWLTINFNVLLPDEIMYSDSQRLLVIGGTLKSTNDDPA